MSIRVETQKEQRTGWPQLTWESTRIAERIRREHLIVSKADACVLTRAPPPFYTFSLATLLVSHFPIISGLTERKGAEPEGKKKFVILILGITDCYEMLLRKS